MSSKKEKPKFDAEKPEEILDEIDADLDAIHKELVEDATKIGEEKERYKAIRSYWVSLADSGADDEDLAPVYLSGVQVLSSARDEIKSIRGQISPLSGLVHAISLSTDSTIGATASTASMFGLTLDPGSVPAFTLTDRYSETKAKLQRLDPSLAMTYEEIREIRHGTRSDPERGALYFIRQSFDHLFSVLAPDDDVRSSPYWTEKERDDPLLVTRPERIEYAANTHVEDPTVRQRLVSSSKHMCEVYRALNNAHARGHLDETKANDAIREMQVIIETWMEEIDPE